MKTRIYSIMATSGDQQKKYMVEAPTASQALRQITNRIYEVKPATGKEVADYLSKGGEIKQVELPERPQADGTASAEKSADETHTDQPETVSSDDIKEEAKTATGPGKATGAATAESEL